MSGASNPNVESTVCPICKGAGRNGFARGPCRQCGGSGRLYRLASSDSSDAWLSAAMLASAVGKDPLDAVFIAALTDSAVLGVFLADDAGSETAAPAELTSPEPEALPEQDSDPETDDDDPSSLSDDSSAIE